MNKKFLIIGALLVLMAMVFTSCIDVLGTGDTGGTKFSKTMTVDGSNLNKKGEALTEGDDGYLAKNYRRFFAKYSDDEKTGWITTTIEVDPEKTILGLNTDGSVITTTNNTAAQGKRGSNFGFIFDYHTTKDEQTKEEFVDFCLIGVQPAFGRFYVERYENINITALKQSTKDGDAPLDTDDSAIGTYYTFGKTGTTFTETTVSPSTDDWRNLPAGALVTNYEKDGTTVKNYSLTISIKQGTVGGNTGTAGTYEIYIGDTKIGTYAGTKTYGTGTYKDYCVGGIGMYASCPVGTKISADYNTTRNTSLSGVDKNVGPKFSEYGAEPVLY